MPRSALRANGPPNTLVPARSAWESPLSTGADVGILAFPRHSSDRGPGDILARRGKNLGRGKTRIPSVEMEIGQDTGGRRRRNPCEDPGHRAAHAAAIRL